MDTSETYIKMSEKAEEIQAQWRPDSGDWFTPRFNLTLHNGTFELNHEVDINTHWLKGRVYCNGDIADWEEEYWCDGCAEIESKWLIWLPCQDQLQELLFTLGEGVTNQLVVLMEYYKISRQLFPSMEQLWLAFVMKEKYGKVWDGEDWVKENG